MRPAVLVWLAAAAVGWGAASPDGGDSASGQVHSWTSREEMLVFFDAATKISAQAINPHPMDDLVQRSLRLLLEDLDPYSHYLSAEAYRHYRQALRPGYGGVGMELAADRRGTLSCWPYPGTPAEAAGIRDGDELLAVDGTPVRGLHLTEVGWRIRGEAGSPVRLTVRSGPEAARDASVIRAEVRAPTALVREAEGPAAWVRVFRFGPTTADELRTIVDALPERAPVVIDLRGNPGGSLYDAIDAARLFLPRGVEIAAVRGREGTSTFRTDARGAAAENVVIVLQDDRTASAAELFIAALTANGRAVTAGAPTFGKGVTQRLIELIDGSALVLTDAQFLGPERVPIPPDGLSPTLPMAADRIAPAELLNAYRAHVAAEGGRARP